MRIAMIGTGYVGIVSGACFSEMGNTVTCVDSDREKIDKLDQGIIPIYEPGLKNMIAQNSKAGRLSFAVDPCEAIKSADAVFICVGTPPKEDGSADLSFVFEAARTIGKYIEGYTVVVTKSTVPVGTTAKVRAIVEAEIALRRGDISFDMANNPEFLKEGAAISDFMGPDRVVIGTSSEKAGKILRRLYSPFFRTDVRIIFMSIESSELTKYASNSMLATRISFMNEIAVLAEKVGADVEQVRQGMAHDKRIGKYFLYAGAGYGGSCFPKDVSALIQTGKNVGYEMKVINAANEVNNNQKKFIAEKVLNFFNGDVRNKKFTVWGLAFKPETDDVREAPALDVIRVLRESGAEINVHDPEASENTRKILGDDHIIYHDNSYDALNGADSLIVMTEWKEYRTPDWRKAIQLMKGCVVFDGRNLYDPEELNELGIRYFGVGYGEKL